MRSPVPLWRTAASVWRVTIPSVAGDHTQVADGGISVADDGISVADGHASVADDGNQCGG